MAIKFKRNCKSEWASTEFAEALYELYVAGEHLDNMKKIALDMVKKHADVLLDESKKEEFAKFNEVLEGSALGADVARTCMASVQPRSASQTYWCWICRIRLNASITTGSVIYCPNNCQGALSLLTD